MRGLKESMQDVMDGRKSPPPVTKTLGMKLTGYGGGKASMQMVVGRRFHNPMGTLHGGIMTDIADATMGVALMSTLAPNETFTTLELKMNFLRPVYKGKISADGVVLHRGRTIALVEVLVKNEEGKPVARGIATQMILPLKQH